VVQHAAVGAALRRADELPLPLVDEIERRVVVEAELRRARTRRERPALAARRDARADRRERRGQPRVHEAVGLDRVGRVAVRAGRGDDREGQLAVVVDRAAAREPAHEDRARRARGLRVEGLVRLEPAQ
jgi:hypothetical protein